MDSNINSGPDIANSKSFIIPCFVIKPYKAKASQDDEDRPCK